MQSGSSTLQNIWRDRTIALDGIAQAVDLMDKLAKTGYLNSRDFETSVLSLLEQNPVRQKIESRNFSLFELFIA